jgi:hypothetical protein
MAARIDKIVISELAATYLRLDGFGGGHQKYIEVSELRDLS